MTLLIVNVCKCECIQISKCTLLQPSITENGQLQELVLCLCLCVLVLCADVPQVEADCMPETVKAELVSHMFL